MGHHRFFNPENVYFQQFRPSPYTCALIRVLRRELSQKSIHQVLDVGTGSGLFLACLAGLGATELYGVDIDPQAIEATTALLKQLHPNLKCNLYQSDMWAPFQSQDKFDVMVANLPHFPGNFKDPTRPSCWGGGNGREIMDKWINGLAPHLNDGGCAYFSHQDLIGWSHSKELIERNGLAWQVVEQWTAFEPPERMAAVEEKYLTLDSQDLYAYGGYVFVEAKIVKVTKQK